MYSPDCGKCEAVSNEAYEAYTRFLQAQTMRDIAGIHGESPASDMSFRLLWWQSEVAMERYRAHCYSHRIDGTWPACEEAAPTA